MRFHRGTTLSRPAIGAAALVAAALGGGCSASLSGPDFSFAEDPKPQQTASGYGRSNLGNDSYGGGGAPYNAPRTYRESSVASQNLPDATPSAYSGGRTGTNYAPIRGAILRATTTRRATAAPPARTIRRATTRTRQTGATAQCRRQLPLRPIATIRSRRRRSPTRVTRSRCRPAIPLYGISRRHNVPVAELMQLNNMTNPNLKLGQKLYLPQGVAAQRSPAPITQDGERTAAAGRGAGRPRRQVSQLLHGAPGRIALCDLALAWRFRRRAAAGQRHHGCTQHQARHGVARSRSRQQWRRPADAAGGRGAAAVQLCAVLRQRQRAFGKSADDHQRRVAARQQQLHAGRDA
ncbi:MAG: LysM peptidoglycan-binding domain-containing protein [Hyphomicrobium sp.]